MATQTKIIISAVDKTKAALASVKTSLAGLSNQSAATMVSFTGLAGVISGAGLLSFVKSGIDALDMLNDLSDRTGVAVETLAGFQLVAKLSDTSLEALGKGLNKLSIYMANNADEAKKLGLTAKDPAEAFLQLSNLLKNLNDVQLRNAVAQKVLGKSYEELLPALNQGAEALREQITLGKEQSGVTKESTERAAEFNDKLDALSLTAQSLAIKIADPLIPVLGTLIDRLKEAHKEGGLLNSVMAGLNEAGIVGNLIGAAGGAKAAGMVPILGGNPLFKAAGGLAGAIAPEFFDDAGVVKNNDRVKSGAPDLESSIKSIQSRISRLEKTPKNAAKIAELNKQILLLRNPNAGQIW